LRGITIDRSGEWENARDSIRVNPEFDSNETEQSVFDLPKRPFGRMGIEASNQTRTESQSITELMERLLIDPFSTTIRREQLGGLEESIGDPI
jgi:hypothetical protein